MRQTALVWLVVLIAACSFNEGDWTYSMEQMDELVTKAKDSATRDKLKAMKAELLVAYKKLPQGEARKEALSDLCSHSIDVREKAEALLDKATGAAAAKAARAEAKRREPFVGLWRGGGMKLDILKSGKVSYERKTGATSKSLTGSLKELHKDRFKVSVLGVGTTFKVDAPPTEQDGVWSMKIDGVQLYRVLMPGIKYLYGLKTCLRKHEGYCLGQRSTFKTTAAAVTVIFDTESVPAAGTTYTVRWIAEAVDGVKPGQVIAAPEGKIGYKGVKAPKTYTISSQYEKPDKGFRPGAYRVEILIGAKLVGKTNFKIEAPKGA